MFSLTDQQWLCLDELLLLTAFQKWGFGNWNQVKDEMNFHGTKFTRDQIEQHYEQYFLNSDDLNPRVDSSLVDSSKNSYAKQAKRFKPYVTKKTDKKPIIELKSEQLLPSLKKVPPAPQQNILGYNLKRKCFYYDLEYDEKAQSILADLEFKDDDTPEQIQFKFQIIENYNRRQQERLRRYNFTIDHHILDIDYRFKQEFSADKYQKEAFLAYRPFTRFQSFQENQETMKIIAKNIYYKSLIQGLKKCRKKIDKQGRVQKTLQYLTQKEQESGEKFGHLKKVYRMSISQPSETLKNQQIVNHFSQIIKRNDESDTSHKISIIYDSCK